MLSGLGVDNKNPDINKFIPDRFRQQFHLLGERTDIAELMSAMDMFCLSSAWGEGFPNVLGEAMAVGLPCVATDVGDSALIIGECGVVVPSKSKDLLLDGLESLLMMESKERKVLEKKSHQRIEDNYTLSAITECYASLYKTVIMDKRKN